MAGKAGRPDGLCTPPSCTCAEEDGSGLIGKVAFPFLRHDAQDAEGPASTRPHLANFFQMFNAMDDVTFGILVGQVQKVNGTSRMCNINSDVADLTQAKGTLI